MDNKSLEEYLMVRERRILKMRERNNLDLIEDPCPFPEEFNDEVVESDYFDIIDDIER